VLTLFTGIPVSWTAVYGNNAGAAGVARHWCIQRLEFLFMNATSWNGLCYFQPCVKLGAETQGNYCTLVLLKPIHRARVTRMYHCVWKTRRLTYILDTFGWNI
jgi:poly(A) polymerase Pap1